MKRVSFAILFAATCALAQQNPAPPPSAAAPPGEKTSLYQKVVVTGTFEPAPLDEVNRTVQVFDVRQDGGLLYNSYADFLKLDSSVDLQERAPAGVSADLSIRGGTFAQSLVLLNGIRLNDAQTAHNNMDLPVPLDALSQIQVLQGSGSSQYGPDAMTGVVNLIAEPPTSPEITLRSALGNFGRNEEDGSLGGVWGRIAEEISFSRDFSSGFMPDRDYRLLSLASLTHIRTGLGATDLILAGSDRPFGADQFYGNFPSWERTKEWFASIRQELGKNTEADLTYRRQTDLFVLFRDDPQIYTNRHIVDSWEGDLRRTDDLPGNSQIHYGAEMFSDAIDSNNLGIHSRAYGGAYAGWDLPSFHRFSFNAGLRTDVYGGYNTQVDPTVSAGYFLTPVFKLRASVSRGFRLPSYTDLYYFDPANHGNPNLKPESDWNYEAGLDIHPGRNLRATLGVFERRDSNLIDYVRAVNANFFQATNFDRIVFTGGEAQLEWQPLPSQTLDFEYTGLSGNKAANPLFVSKYVFNYPMHSGVVAWRGTLRDWFVARTRIGVLERYDSYAYAVWDASLAWARGRVRPFLQLTNLTDTIYYDIPGVVMPQRGVLGGVEITTRQ